MEGQRHLQKKTKQLSQSMNWLLDALVHFPRQCKVPKGMSTLPNKKKAGKWAWALSPSRPRCWRVGLLSTGVSDIPQRLSPGQTCYKGGSDLCSEDKDPPGPQIPVQVPGLPLFISWETKLYKRGGNLTLKCCKIQWSLEIQPQIQANPYLWCTNNSPFVF